MAVAFRYGIPFGGTDERIVRICNFGGKKLDLDVEEEEEEEEAMMIILI